MVTQTVSAESPSPTVAEVGILNNAAAKSLAIKTFEYIITIKHTVAIVDKKSGSVLSKTEASSHCLQGKGYNKILFKLYSIIRMHNHRCAFHDTISRARWKSEWHRECIIVSIGNRC